MNKATIFRSAIFLLVMVLVGGFSAEVNAQTKASFDGEFVFFLNGANVKIPTLDGTVVADPLDPTSGNTVFRINYGDWAESGFRWPNGGRDSSGVDASSVIGDAYGESDTLFFKMMSDTANGAAGKSGAIFVAFLDTDTGINYETDNLPFRVRWTIPGWAHDGQWHEFAIPLPPATVAALDSAKAGLDVNGDSLEIEVDSLFSNWNYAGAWANPGVDGGAGLIVTQNEDNWEEFDWESVKYFGIHYDFDGPTLGGGGPIFFDDFYIGTSQTDITDAPPTNLPTVEVSASEGVNTISWSSVADVGGYNIYFSESEITDVLAEGVARIGARTFDGDLTIDHSITAPHPDLAADFEAYYAVTALSGFGAESGPATAMISADANVTESYAVELNDDALDLVYSALEDDEMPAAEDLAAYFPEGYYPFTINEERKWVNNGNGGDNDADISGQFWVGFGSAANELIVYAEITDDANVYASESIGTGGAWAFDNWEMGIGNYTPESFIISSTHTDFWRGEDPDYQFRAGMMSDRAPFVHESARNGEIPNSQTIGEDTDTGYRLLTLINTVELSSATQTADDELFDFPGSDDITLYPFNIAINDADDLETQRETQVSWSNRIDESVDDWWNTPARWQTVAFVGLNRVPTSIEDETSTDQPLKFSLDQNYPNPFNPTTKITFTLAKSSDVTLEVYNMLGQKVATLLQNEKMSAGKYTQTFNALNLSSGMYFYRLSTPSFVHSRKMMLIK